MQQKIEFNSQIYQFKISSLKTGQIRWKVVSKFPCNDIKSAPSVVPYEDGILALNYIPEPEPGDDYRGDFLESAFYQPQSKTWTMLSIDERNSSMKSLSFFADSVNANGEIYSFGGLTVPEETNDLVTNSYQTVSRNILKVQGSS